MVQQVSTEGKICRGGNDGFVLPLTKAEDDLPDVLRAIIYAFGLMYLFLGVSLIADKFMVAIETVTSRRRQMKLPNGHVITARVWNDTVANLTLMALGSSAPEILLAVTELFKKEMYFGELGAATIVGSASFNLLIIVGLCIFVIPSSEIRRISEVPVFIITVIFMFVAYGWVVLTIAVISPDVVEIWEAVVTLSCMPVLVYLSYLADIGKFGDFRRYNVARADLEHRACELLGDFDKETKAALREGLRTSPSMRKKIENPTSASIAELRKMVTNHLVQRRSRAARRIEATRSLTGGKRVFWEFIPSLHWHHTVSGVNVIEDIPYARAKGMGGSHVEFATARQYMSCSLDEKPVTLVRCGDVSSRVSAFYEVVESVNSIPTMNTSTTSSADTQRPSRGVSPVNNRSSITRLVRLHSSEEGSSSESWGMHTVFEPGEDKKTIMVHRPDQFYTDGIRRQFAVKLRRAVEDSGAAVAIGNTLEVMVQRHDGCLGKASCNFRTERLTAVPGFDFTHVEGTVTFDHGVTEQFIDINILPTDNATQRDFILVLEDPVAAEFDPHTDGGAESEILTIKIAPANRYREGMTIKAFNWLDQKMNFAQIRLGNHDYAEQFTSAIYCNGSPEEQKEASMFDWLFHILALPWKLLFVFVPPTSYCGGWICFYMSLVFIGALTAVIGDLAELFGCVLDIPNMITSITFVALGTSMPDLFASKTAATQDPTADASIVNVTGSNSVNVFLGLGLPWTVGSLYWRFAEWSEEWAHRYPGISRKHEKDKVMVFVVPSGDLSFGVMVFTMMALLAMTVLVVRRRRAGGELGGPLVLKLGSSICLALFWCGYIGLSSWWSLRQDKADTSEKIIVMVSTLIVTAAIPFGIVLSMAIRTEPLSNNVSHDHPDAEYHDAPQPKPAIQVETTSKAEEFPNNVSEVLPSRSNGNAVATSAAASNSKVGQPLGRLIPEGATGHDERNKTAFEVAEALRAAELAVASARRAAQDARSLTMRAAQDARLSSMNSPGSNTQHI